MRSHPLEGQKYGSIGISYTRVPPTTGTDGRDPRRPVGGATETAPPLRSLLARNCNSASTGPTRPPREDINRQRNRRKKFLEFERIQAQFSPTLDLSSVHSAQFSPTLDQQSPFLHTRRYFSKPQCPTLDQQNYRCIMKS